MSWSLVSQIFLFLGFSIENTDPSLMTGLSCLWLFLTGSTLVTDMAVGDPVNSAIFFATNSESLSISSNFLWTSPTCLNFKIKIREIKITFKKIYITISREIYKYLATYSARSAVNGQKAQDKELVKELVMLSSSSMKCLQTCSLKKKFVKSKLYLFYYEIILQFHEIYKYLWGNETPQTMQFSPIGTLFGLALALFCNILTRFSSAINSSNLQW